MFKMRVGFIESLDQVNMWASDLASGQPHTDKNE